MLKRNFATLLVLILALCALCACGDGSTPSDTTPNTTPQESDTQAPPTEILLSELSRYAVVRPDDAERAEIEAAAAVYEALGELGVTEIKTDFLKPGIADGKYVEGEYEILVGQTNRAETAQLLAKMRDKDYAYGVVGKKIVIVGGSDDATVEAAAEFVKNVVRAAHDDGVLMSEADAVLKCGEYAVDGLTLAGIDMADYRIVYQSSSQFGCKELALSLSRAILSETGYRVEAVSDKEDYAGGHEILIGQTSRSVDAYSAQLETNGYYIGTQGSFIVIYGNSSLGLATAVKELRTLISEAAEQGGSPALELKEKTAAASETDRLTSMSFNLKVNPRTDERDERVISMILQYMPDTVGVQEASPSWMETLKSSLSAYYGYVGVGRDGGNNGEYNAVFYLKDKFEAVESDTKWLSATPDYPSRFPTSSLNRIYTYVQLRRISDGAEFIHINTHFDHKSAEARAAQAEVLMQLVEAKAGLPMLVSGDFNCTAGSVPYNAMVAGTLSSAAEVAQQAEKGCTFHNYGQSDKVIDFIFVNTDSVKVERYRVCNEKINGDYASDHHPILIEYYLLK